MRIAMLLITLTIVTMVTMVRAKSSHKLQHGAAGEKDLKSLTAACKDGADFCEDPEGYPTQLVSGVLEKKRAKRELRRRLPQQVK